MVYESYQQQAREKKNRGGGVLFFFMGMSEADYNKWLTLFIIRKTSESEDKNKEKDNDKRLFILKGVYVKRRGSKDDFQDK